MVKLDTTEPPSPTIGRRQMMRKHLHTPCIPLKDTSPSYRTATSHSTQNTLHLCSGIAVKLKEDTHSSLHISNSYDVCIAWTFACISHEKPDVIYRIPR